MYRELEDTLQGHILSINIRHTIEGLKQDYGNEFSTRRTMHRSSTDAEQRDGKQGGLRRTSQTTNDKDTSGERKMCIVSAEVKGREKGETIKSIHIQE